MGDKELTQTKFMCLQLAQGDLVKAKELLEWILEKPVKEESTVKLFPLLGGEA